MSNKSSVELIKAIYLNWGNERGFGQLYFYQKDGQIYCDNELLSKDTIKEILCSMVDDSVLTCESELNKN